MVLFPVPLPIARIVAPAPPLSNFNGPPAVPFGIPIVVARVSLNVSDPTVMPPPALVPASVALVLVTGLLKMAFAPTALGIVPSTQLAVLFQFNVPPAVENVSARICAKFPQRSAEIAAATKTEHG